MWVRVAGLALSAMMLLPACAERDAPVAGPRASSPTGSTSPQIQGTITPPARTTSTTSGHTKSTDMSPAEPSSPAPSTSTSSTSTTTRPPSAKTRPRPRFVEWIVGLGVAGGVDIPEESFVALLADQSCADARQVARDPDQPLPSYYDAAAAACLAVTSGNAQLWALASRASAQSLHPRDCIDRAVIAFLRRLINAHKQHPEVQLRPTRARAGEAFPCPRILRVSPEHGSSQGGYPVRVFGVHLPATVVIHFNQGIDLESRDTRITVRSEMGGTSAVITVPPRLQGADRDVTIYPEGWPLAPLSGAQFTYDDPPATPSSRPSTSRTSPR